MNDTINSFIGLKFNRWTIVGITDLDDISRKGKTYASCKCECGTVRNLVLRTVTNGISKSCGCLRSETSCKLRTKHGQSYSKEYTRWRGMKERCDNPRNSHYPLYGERGIGYSKEWENFETFFRDMGNCPDDFQLDRIDVNIGYSKENCRWVDKTIQAYNIRKKSNNTSGRTGVYLTDSGKYHAKITVYKKVISLGVFSTFEEACKAREEAELKYYGVSKE